MLINVTRNKPTMVLDCHSILHALRFGIRQRVSSPEDAQASTLLGFLTYVNMLVSAQQTDKFVFAWDHKISIRKNDYTFYKQRSPAKAVSPQEAEIDTAIIKAFGIIRDGVVPRLGFIHNHHHEGYEADDIIAATVKHNTGSFLLVSTDHDLMQLLHHCSIYRPKESIMYTARLFQEEHGIDCDQWAEVKAIAGCSSDTIPGIDGVGEKTAIKYIRGELKETTKAYGNITSDKGKQIIERNRRLVSLPLEGCPVPALAFPDNSTPHGVDEVSEQFGLNIPAHGLAALRGIMKR